VLVNWDLVGFVNADASGKGRVRGNKNLGVARKKSSVRTGFKTELKAGEKVPSTGTGKDERKAGKEWSGKGTRGYKLTQGQTAGERSIKVGSER